jgi:hypothetical protein
VKRDLSLVGLRLYSPAEAAALTNIPAPKIRRWLCGHALARTGLIASHEFRSPMVEIGGGLASELDREIERRTAKYCPWHIEGDSQAVSVDGERRHDRRGYCDEPIGKFGAKRSRNAKRHADDRQVVRRQPAQR